MTITVNLQADAIFNEVASEIQDLLETKGFTTEQPIDASAFHSELKGIIAKKFNDGIYYPEEATATIDPNEII
jgi:hypothetical protein